MEDHLEAQHVAMYPLAQFASERSEGRMPHVASDVLDSREGTRMRDLSWVKK